MKKSTKKTASKKAKATPKKKTATVKKPVRQSGPPKPPGIGG